MNGALKEARAIAALGGPLVINNLVQVTMQVTDTIMAGRLSGMDLAAVAVGGAVFMPVMVIALGILMALTPTVAQLHGAGKHTEVGHWVRQALWLGVIVTVPTVIALRGAGVIMDAFSVDPSIIPAAGGYLEAVSWGMLPMNLYFVLRFFSEGTSETRPMMYIALVALPLNVFGNWLFMYGGFGAPALGAVGCGVATAIVMWAMLGMMIVNIRRRRYRRFAAFESFEWPRPRALGALLWLGVPIGVTLFMEGSLFGAAALLMAQLGAEFVAAHQIAINFAAMMFMIPMGLSFAISVRVGQAIGRSEPAAARHSGLVGIGLCAAIMLLSALNMLVFRAGIVGFYTSDAVVGSTAVGLLMYAAVFQLSDGVQVAAAGVLRGYKDTRMSMVLTAIAYWGIGFPLAWWFGIRLGYGANAVWIGLIAGLSAAAALLLWRFMRLAYNTADARVD